VTAGAVETVRTAGGTRCSFDPHCAAANGAFDWFSVRGANWTGNRALLMRIYKWVFQGVSILFVCEIKPTFVSVPCIVDSAHEASRCLL